jgi:hypothetical protein
MTRGYDLHAVGVATQRWIGMWILLIRVQLGRWETNIVHRLLITTPRNKADLRAVKMQHIIFLLFCDTRKDIFIVFTARQVSEQNR